MRPFEYVRPETLSQVVELLAEHQSEARILAGGTDLLVALRRGVGVPRVVVDVKRVRSLESGVKEAEGFLRIGARCVMTDLLADGRVQRWFPALVEAASVVGSVQIRNRATVCGNIANASPAADTAPALLVYDAQVAVTGPAGSRRIHLRQFFTGPGTTVLAPGEVIEWLDLPIPSEPAGSSFQRITRRLGVDIATVSVACRVNSRANVRLAFGAAAPTPLLVEEAGESFPGTDDSHDLIRRAIAKTSPRTDVRGARDYRQAMLQVLGRRALAGALARLRGETAYRVHLQ